MQRLGSIGLILALAAAMIFSGTARASASNSFVLVNDGSHVIYHVYVSRASSGTWEYPDVLGQNVLSPGYQTTVDFPDSTFDTCYWDISVVYADGNKTFDWDEDLCTYGKLTAHY